MSCQGWHSEIHIAGWQTAGYELLISCSSWASLAVPKVEIDASDEEIALPFRARETRFPNLFLPPPVADVVDFEGFSCLGNHILYFRIWG